MPLTTSCHNQSPKLTPPLLLNAQEEISRIPSRGFDLDHNVLEPIQAVLNDETQREGGSGEDNQHVSVDGIDSNREDEVITPKSLPLKALEEVRPNNVLSMEPTIEHLVETSLAPNMIILKCLHPKWSRRWRMRLMNL